jgi:2,3-bisphosphoglycerate-dependent phosphoglycerate mutase
MPHLVLIRHGQSEWNLQNRFTGWTDVELTEQGIEEAHTAGQLLKQEGLEFGRGFCSVLKRAIRTLWIALDEMDQMYLPYEVSWRLNERHYGALQGLNKAETAEKYGQEQVHAWRRSYATRPPALAQDDPRHPRFDPRYRMAKPTDLPACESLKDTQARLMPFWLHVRAALKKEPGILVAAHGNSIRALIKHLAHISDEEIPGLEVPTGNPLMLDFSPGLDYQGGRYLDPDRAGPVPLASA